MITTRERITIGELIGGVMTSGGADLNQLIRTIVPLDSHHVLYASQGKAAFEQIVLSAGLQGSRILMPAFFPDDFVGIFLKYGITPTFVDVDPDSYHLDLRRVGPEHLEGAKALVVEHTFGLPADGPAYRAFCDAHDLVLIEDCARALGAAAGGKLVGSFGQFAMFSLPKCTPVRAGGMALSEAPLTSALLPARIGAAGLVHALTLVKFPGCSVIEGAAYSLIADTPLYPLEVGNYDPLPARRLDGLSKVMLKAFLPRYREAVARKQATAKALKVALEPLGFAFQCDQHGEHLYTSVSAEPPIGCDADQLKQFLLAHGVKASAMWRNAIGVSEFGRTTWNASPQATPVALRLSKRLIQFPVSRFRTDGELQRIVDLCDRFLRGAAAASSGRVRFAS
jgi:dTDP-4-amino-4,6-dideoxygalactose transaminase